MKIHVQKDTRSPLCLSEKFPQTTQHLRLKYLRYLYNLRELMLQLLYKPELLVSIEARTSLENSTWKVTMTNNLRLKEELVENRQQVGEPLRLLGGASVTRQSALIKFTTLIADADRAMVVRNGMSTNLQQHAVLSHSTVTTDIEVVADSAELSSLMVTEQLLHCIVFVALCSRAVHHQILNVIGRHQIRPSHNNNRWMMTKIQAFCLSIRKTSFESKLFSNGRQLHFHQTK